MAARPGLTLALPSRDAQAMDFPPDPMAGRWMDISRARDELGFAPRFTPEAAMADYIEWLVDHPL